MEACSLASERLAELLGEAAADFEPVAAVVSQSSPWARRSRSLMAPLVNAALRSMEREGVHANRLLGALAQRPRLWLERFHSGPSARSGAAFFPALTQIDEIAARDSAGAWSPSLSRQAFILHEAGHVEHRRASPEAGAFFGLSHLPARAACALALLADSAPGAPASPFETACATLMAEGYADCFSALALGGGRSSQARARAREWGQIRQARALGLGADPDPLHDTREALGALIEALDTASERLDIDSESLRALCCRAAAIGLCRWICALPARNDLSSLQGSFYAKCAQLARAGDIGEPPPLSALWGRALEGPLGPALAPLDWIGCRRQEIESAEALSDDSGARAALALMMDLADGAGAPAAPRPAPGPSALPPPRRRL